jgi:hypothetical protein
MHIIMAMRERGIITSLEGGPCCQVIMAHIITHCILEASSKQGGTLLYDIVDFPEYIIM